MSVLGQRLPTQLSAARAFMAVGASAAVVGAVDGTAALLVSGVALLFCAGGVQAQAAADGRAARDSEAATREHPLLREGRSAWTELPSEARIDARPVLDSLTRYVEACRVAPHDAELAEQARVRRDALVELRDAYRSLRARELVAGGDLTDVATTRLLAEKVREVAAEIENL